MKKILLILFLFISTIVNAQDYSLFISPLSLKNNSLEFNFEYKDGKSALIASYGFPLHRSIVGETYDDFYVSPNQFKDLMMYSRIVRLGYSYYIFGNMYCGVGVNSYTSVFYGLANPYPTRFGNVYGSFYHTSIRTEIGYDLIFHKRLIFKIYAGLEPMRCSGRIKSTSANKNDAIYMEKYIKLTMNNNLTLNELENSEVTRYNDTVNGNVYGNFKMGAYIEFKVGFKLNK